MSLLDKVKSLFAAPARHLYWARLPDEQAGEPPWKPEPIIPGEAYVVVRMREMSLKYARVLWRKYYPVLHGFTRHGQREEHTLVGPGQLKDISDANLDRVINLNQRLAGPIPYTGGDLELVAGLYSVPAEDAAKALIQTVGDLASIAGIGLANVPAIANAVKSGVESIFSLNECGLQLGVRDTHAGETPLTTGAYVSMAVDKTTVNPHQLWLYQSRLIRGLDPVQGRPVDEDYFVIAIEKRTHRDDWATLAGFAEHEAGFAEVMRGTGTIPEKRTALGALWPAFQQTLASSADLIKSDKAAIEASVAADLNKRLAAANPFEARSVGGITRDIKRDDFDYVDIDVDDTAGAPVARPFA